MPEGGDSFSVISRQLGNQALAGSSVIEITPAFENTEELSLFSAGDTLILNKGIAGKEETVELKSFSQDGSSIILNDLLEKNHEVGSFVTISQSSSGGLTVNKTAVVTDTLIVGDPDQSEEENILEIQEGHIAADADLTVQGDIFASHGAFDNVDIQGEITVQGETVDLTSINSNNSTQEELSEISTRLNQGLSGIADALVTSNQDHSNDLKSILNTFVSGLSTVTESIIEKQCEPHEHVVQCEPHEHVVQCEPHEHEPQHIHQHIHQHIYHDHSEGYVEPPVLTGTGFFYTGTGFFTGSGLLNTGSGLLNTGSGINPYLPPYEMPLGPTDPTSPCPNTGYYLRVDECINCNVNEGLNQIGVLARELIEFEFDYITGEAAVRSELYTISGSLSGRLGELNVLLNQNFCFTGCDGNPFPRIGREEGDILQQLYLRDYNTKQAQKVMRGFYDSAAAGGILQNEAEWTELTEGDTTIKRSPGSSPTSASNRLALSKDFKALSEAADRKIKELVYNYNMYGAQPRQVAGEDGAYDLIVNPRVDPIN